MKLVLIFTILLQALVHIQCAPVREKRGLGAMRMGKRLVAGYQHNKYSARDEERPDQTSKTLSDILTEPEFQQMLSNYLSHSAGNTEIVKNILLHNDGYESANINRPFPQQKFNALRLL